METNINTFEQLKRECIERGKEIYEVAQENMALNSDLKVEQVRAHANRSLFAMKEAIQVGLVSKELSMSGMCGQDCHRIQERFKVQPA